MKDNEHEQKPRFMTIREVAKTGILSEYSLRMMNARGELPAIKTGNRTLINYDLLIKKLNTL